MNSVSNPKFRFIYRFSGENGKSLALGIQVLGNTEDPVQERSKTDKDTTRIVQIQNITETSQMTQKIILKCNSKVCSLVGSSWQSAPNVQWMMKKQIPPLPPGVGELRLLLVAPLKHSDNTHTTTVKPSLQWCSYK